MNILVINSGSASLKLALLATDEAGIVVRSPSLACGYIERFGPNATTSFRRDEEPPLVQERAVADHRAGVACFVHWLRSAMPEHVVIGAVGHRVVHGGEHFRNAVIINDDVLKSLDGLAELAPLHNPGALAGIRAAKAALGLEVPMVAVFDTTFFHALPEHVARYPIPYELCELYGIRRYGFHGIAHESMLRRYTELSGVGVEEATLVTIQLGNGCSATAIRNGQPVETSMGFTPLEGLMMGTRPGDIDAGIISHLARREALTMSEIESMLNTRCGLLGVSGQSSDIRDLLAVAASDSRAALAIEMFCHRVKKYLGAYLAILGGAKAIVFGGGTGEHQPAMRQRVCADLDCIGLRLDPTLNAAAIGRDARISMSRSATEIWVIRVDESRLIAEQTLALLAQSQHCSILAGRASSR